MNDTINVSFDKNKKDKSCLIVSRTYEDGTVVVLNAFYNDAADEMYKLLTKRKD